MFESSAERSALGAAPDIAVVVDVGLNFLCPKSLTELLKNPTSKQTNGPGTISASVSHHKKPVSICSNERDLFFHLTDQNGKLEIGFP